MTIHASSRICLKAVGAVLLTLLFNGCGGTTPTVVTTPPITPAVVPNISATVDLSKPGSPIPQHFMGFSMDSNVVSAYVGSGATANPALVNLITNFNAYNGVPSLRPAAAPATSTSSNISASFLAALTSLEKATQAPLIVTIGLGNYNPSYAGNVARSVMAAMGSANGLAFELGNEPDILVKNGNRLDPYTFPQYLTEYQGYEAAVAPFLPGKNAAGMAAGGGAWDTANDTAFLPAAVNNLAVVTSHEYPLSICTSTGGVTVAHLLSDNIAHAFYTRYSPVVAAATPFNLPVRAGEMNSVSCSGLAGVSDTFASGLWLLDSLFELRSAGAAGMNLHTGSPSSGIPDQPYNAFYVNASQLTVRPVYYGMMMFAEAMQNGGQLVNVTSTLDGSQNVKIWASLDAGKKLRITVIEKDMDTSSQLVSINLGVGATAIGQSYNLVTNSSLGVNATDQIYLAGQTLDGSSTGSLSGSQATTPVIPSKGTYTFKIADGSAVTLVVQL